MKRKLKANCNLLFSCASAQAVPGQDQAFFVFRFVASSKRL